MTHYLDNIHRCKVYEGFRALIQGLRQQPVKISILTALNHDALHDQLNDFNLGHYFDAAFGLYNHHALSKVQRGHELMQHVGVPAHETIIIGDTDHDLEVAQSLGIDVILLADGHQNETRLRKTMATVINLNRKTE
jgi:phosphoglycolate phosphatase